LILVTHKIVVGKTTYSGCQLRRC